MGCAGGKPAGGASAAGTPGKAQAQHGGVEAQKDAAAAEIQGAAGAYMRSKKAKQKQKEQKEEAGKDKAAAEIQGQAANYLRKKRENAKATADASAPPAAAEGEGVVGFITGIFSQRAPAAAEIQTAAAPPPKATA